MHSKLDVAPRLEIPVQLDAHDRDGEPLGRSLRSLATPAGARQHDDQRDQRDRCRREQSVGPRKSHSTPLLLRLPTYVLLPRRPPALGNAATRAQKTIAAVTTLFGEPQREH